MGYIKWGLAGLLGAAAGVMVWTVAGELLQMELGWMAWVVGLLAGLGVRYAAREFTDGPAPGVVAVIIALAAIPVAKYHVAAPQMVAEAQEFWDGFAIVTDDSMIGTVADEIVLEYQAQAKPVEWPDEEMTWEDAFWPEDYPPEVWEQAAQRWANLTTREQERRRRDHEAKVLAVLETKMQPVRAAAFRSSFGAWDLIWFCLASITAFRVASARSDA